MSRAISENFDILFESLLFNQQTNFNALQLGVYRDLIDNKRYRLYARLSANFYDYEFVSDTDTNRFSGTSYGLGLGFQFKLSENFMLLSEYNYDDYSRLDTSTFNIGFAIAF
ncbi:MAG: outer membrane beta-barrel protein [Enterobacterales bacterium]|nr:outer membrane beta-barrel protein [Enterobacterales bacterium]